MSATAPTLAEVNDFSRLEEHIVMLLRRAVAGQSPAVHVLTAADLSDVREQAQRTPALHVVSDGFTPIDQGYKTALLQHRWYVVAAVKSAADARSGRAARVAAGPLLALAMGALLSEHLPGTTRPIELDKAPRGTYVAGYYYLPSAWTAETVFRKP